MRFYATTKVVISASHQLLGDIASYKCKNPHGHNWEIEVTIGSDGLNCNGMVIDFSDVKKCVDNYDHHYLNDYMPDDVSPTSENLALVLYGDLSKKIEKLQKDELLGRCIWVDSIKVQETPDNIVELCLDDEAM